MPTIAGILETSLYVRDLERSQRFYEGVFGFTPMLQDERMCALDIGGHQVLLLFVRGASAGGNPVPGGCVPPHDGNGQLHLAFTIAPDDVEAWRSVLSQSGITVESEVRPPRGGVSLYFRDPDEHLIELSPAKIWPFAGTSG